MSGRRKNAPRLFVGSSKESKRFADAIQQNLDDDADVTVWDQNVFTITKSALESLMDQLGKSDFAIFVFAADDVVRMRQKKYSTVRDNVVFELGLFMGTLGRDRTFIVAAKNGRLRIPTDLLGITVGRFNSKRVDKNWRAALGAFCADVRVALSNFRGTPARRKAR
ncbi:MAG TPA: nucleotide-binding protein [Thermoanaerobaculia bacterium]|jgi:predicted nucleotide-binding protein|nr:nucleotide-binding protein [Thermoanaerobaculia bacterium]